MNDFNVTYEIADLLGEEIRWNVWKNSLELN